MFPLPYVPESAAVNRDAGSVITNGDHQGFRKECAAAARPIQQFEAFISGPWRKIGSIHFLVHHIDKCLCVVPMKATDRVTLILVREDRLDQGGEFMRSERTSDQTLID